MAGVVCGLEAGHRDGEEGELPGHAWTWAPTTATQTSAGITVQLSLLQSNTQVSGSGVILRLVCLICFKLW